MSSDVSWHIRDKLWPMPKHGSIILYVHGNQRFVRTDSPGRPPWLSHSSWTMSTVKTSVSLALQLTVSSTTNCATERDHAGLCLREPPKLYSSFLRMPSATGFTIQASAAGASSATMTINYDYKLPSSATMTIIDSINYDNNSLSWHPPFFRVKHKTESSDCKAFWNSE